MSGDQHGNHDYVSRRAVLRAGAGAAVGAVVGSRIARGEEGTNMTTATSRPTIVGSGARTYEVIDNWPRLPDGKKFGNTHHVQELADGRILIHNASPTGDCVAEFDPSDGKFIRSWGKEFFPGAHGMQL